MIRYILSFLLSCHLFVATHAEPILGENVQPANPRDFPFVASLGLTYPPPLTTRNHFCGGSLITKRHVLTAAHCLEMYSITDVDVIIGEVSLSKARTRYNVNSWITYKQWAVTQQIPIDPAIDDIAIVELQTPVDRSGINPVVLTDLNNERLYRTGAVMAGWGDTSTVSSPDILLRASMTILSPDECSNKVKLITNKVFPLPRRFLCTWAEPYVLTGCGDSGGPLLSRNNALLGVTSSKCPNETKQWGNFPVEFLNQYKINLYASVDYYRDFIESITGLVRGRIC